MTLPITNVLSTGLSRQAWYLRVTALPLHESSYWHCKMGQRPIFLGSCCPIRYSLFTFCMVGGQFNLSRFCLYVYIFNGFLGYKNSILLNKSIWQK